MFSIAQSLVNAAQHLLEQFTVVSLRVPWLLIMLLCPALIYGLWRTVHSSKYFSWIWGTVFGFTLLWAGMASIVFLTLARHVAYPPPRVPAAPSADFLLGLMWWRLLLPGYPALLAAVMGWRQRFRMKVVDAMVAVTIAGVQLDVYRYYLSQSPPDIKTRREWASAGARVDLGPSGEVRGIHSFSARLDLIKDHASLIELSIGPFAPAPEELKRLADLPNVEKLSLFGEGVTDEHLKYLALLPKLKKLEVGGSITHKGLELVAAVPNLESLHISYLEIDEKCCEALSHAAHLKELNLFNANVTDAGVAHLARIDSLMELAAERSLITGRSLCGGGMFKSLETLRVHGCPIDDAGLRCIASLPKIRYISHTSRIVTGAAVKQIQDQYMSQGQPLKIGY